MNLQNYRKSKKKQFYLFRCTPFITFNHPNNQHTMSQSLSKIYIHLVFHVKYSSIMFRDSDLCNVYQYIGACLKEMECEPIAIGGMKDHVHILFVLSRNFTMSQVVMNIKRKSSRMIKALDERYRSFSWQSGYGCFSVSQSMLNNVVHYVNTQWKHHQKISTKSEYCQLLTLHHINYDSTMIFDE